MEPPPPPLGEGPVAVCKLKLVGQKEQVALLFCLPPGKKAPVLCVCGGGGWLPQVLQGSPLYPHWQQLQQGCQVTPPAAPALSSGRERKPGGIWGRGTPPLS